MVFNNWTRELYVNGDRLGTCTNIQFDVSTINVTACEDEVNCFETVLCFYNSCIITLTLDDKRLILETKNPLHR